jgi:hypothetical protein
MAITTNNRIRRHRVCFTLSENPIRTVSLNGRGVNLSLDTEGSQRIVGWGAARRVNAV